ncbi:MAG: hypothetical protein M3P91_06335 [Actinomycetota bacterium]|nr:hypothetical protein [Actinomycetota bacterium]
MQESDQRGAPEPATLGDHGAGNDPTASPAGSSPPGEGDPPLAELLAPIEGIDRRPLPDHPAAYDELHRRLQHMLSDRDGP